LPRDHDERDDLKGKDIVVGGEYAVTNGRNSFNRNLSRARRCEVIETGVQRSGWRNARADGVTVRFLDEPNKELFLGLFSRHERDFELTVTSSDVWMPWSEIEGQIEAHNALKAEVEERRAKSKARRDVIFAGLEGAVGTIDEVRWEGGRYPEGDMIELPAEVVEALLDRIDS
jgi:hypothetical protein